MKQIEKIAEGAAYTCVSVGEMATLGEHILALGPDVKIPGKVFAGGALQATGAEISFQSFPVGGQTGFLHVTPHLIDLKQRPDAAVLISLLMHDINDRIFIKH